MLFRLPSEQEREDVVAYLKTFSGPAPATHESKRSFDAMAGFLDAR